VTFRSVVDGVDFGVFPDKSERASGTIDGPSFFVRELFFPAAVAVEKKNSAGCQAAAHDAKIPCTLPLSAQQILLQRGIRPIAPQ
jgi:hypothetical protein